MLWRTKEHLSKPLPSKVKSNGPRHFFKVFLSLPLKNAFSILYFLHSSPKCYESQDNTAQFQTWTQSRGQHAHITYCNALQAFWLMFSSPRQIFHLTLSNLSFRYMQIYLNQIKLEEACITLIITLFKKCFL